jgi:hypothetical protein
MHRHDLSIWTYQSCLSPIVLCYSVYLLLYYITSSLPEESDMSQIDAYILTLHHTGDTLQTCSLWVAVLKVWTLLMAARAHREASYPLTLVPVHSTHIPPPKTPSGGNFVLRPGRHQLPTNTNNLESSSKLTIMVSSFPHAPRLLASSRRTGCRVQIRYHAPCYATPHLYLHHLTTRTTLTNHAQNNE